MERTNANGERLIDLHMNVLDAWVTSSLIFFFKFKESSYNIWNECKFQTGNVHSVLYSSRAFQGISET